MFGIFVHCCRLDYGVREDNSDSICAVTEVCKHISSISQQFRDPKNGHWFILTSDQLYDHYLEFIPNLTSYTTKWMIKLILQYYQALTEEFRYIIINNNSFSIPFKNWVPSKEELVAALIVVRSHVVQVYKTLTL